MKKLKEILLYLKSKILYIFIYYNNHIIIIIIIVALIATYDFFLSNYYNSIDFNIK